MDMNMNIHETDSMAQPLESREVLLKLIPPHFKRTYGLRQVFTSGKKENVLKYEFSSTYVRTIAPGWRIFEIERKSALYINDELPDSVADELAARAGAVFYPLQIYADFEGSFAGVHNTSEIINRWFLLRPQLEEFFEGDFVGRYLNQMDRTLSDAHQILNAIGKDLFINSLFQNIYKKYPEQGTIKSRSAFPLIGYAEPLDFEIEESLKETYNDSDQIEIRRWGHCCDLRSVADAIREDDFAAAEDTEEPLQGTYTARYGLNATTKSIEAMEVEWTLELEENEKVFISLYEIPEPVEEKVPVKRSFII